jgi:hypothetical protein
MKWCLVPTAVLALACSKKDDSKPAPAPAPAPAPVAAETAPAPEVSCKDAATAYAKLLAADPGNPFGAAKPNDGQTMLLRYTLEEACEQDWPAAARACLAKAGSATAGGSCFDAEMRARVDMLVKQEIDEQLKNKADNEAREAAEKGSGSGS